MRPLPVFPLPARNIARLLLMPFAALCLSGCAASSLSDAPSHTLPLSQTVSALAHKHRVCAVAVAVIRNRKLHSVESASGCAAGADVNSASVFQAASLSKPVFAYAVLKLAQQGKLDLDAPVIGYLPQGYRHRFNPMTAEPSDLVTDPRLQAVTARMVLNHTSGLPNWSSGPLRFVSAPGARWVYSGEGYVLLQRAVEAITGQPLDRFMASEVFRPLAMERSSYVWREQFATTLLPGTKANGAPRAGTVLTQPNAASSLYTSAADYGKFLATVLSDEAILRQIALSPVPVDRALDLAWGLGWGLEQHQDGPSIWQWGNNMGYRAFAMASVKTGDGFVMLTNSENGLALARPLAGKIFPLEHRLFQSGVLGTDVLTLACTTLRLCL